jgi:hypothetical protein
MFTGDPSRATHATPAPTARALSRDAHEQSAQRVLQHTTAASSSGLPPPSQFAFSLPPPPSAASIATPSPSSSFVAATFARAHEPDHDAQSVASGADGADPYANVTQRSARPRVAPRPPSPVRAAPLLPAASTSVLPHSATPTSRALRQSLYSSDGDSNATVEPVGRHSESKVDEAQPRRRHPDGALLPPCRWALAPKGCISRHLPHVLLRLCGRTVTLSERWTRPRTCAAELAWTPRRHAAPTHPPT